MSAGKFCKYNKTMKANMTNIENMHLSKTKIHEFAIQKLYLTSENQKYRK